MNLNAKQWIGITIAVLSVLAVSTTQLTELLGPDMAKKMVSLALLLNSIFGGVVAAIGGTPTPEDQVRSVLGMHGVERLEVNSKATPALAAMAMDENVNKISPVRGQNDAVAAVANTAETPT